MKEKEYLLKLLNENVDFHNTFVVMRTILEKHGLMEEVSELEKDWHIDKPCHWEDYIDHAPPKKNILDKPECPCEDGIDSKVCVGCEHSEDEKKEYRPYESPVEMIVDFIDRFKVNCPSYCEPLIWVKTKSNDARFLMTGFGKKVSVDGVSYSLDELFKYYTYLDGSPVGMEVKE